MRNESRTGRAISSVFLVLMSLSFLFPLVFMVANSFKTSSAYYLAPFSLPSFPLDFGNYRSMFSQFGIVHYYFNTLQVLVASIVVITAAAVMASYGFAKLVFPGKQAVYLVIIGTMVIPPQITLIPTYVMLARAGMLDTYVSLTLVFAAFYLPNSILLITAYFKSIPQEMIESAEVEGCRYLRKLLMIVASVGAPIIITSVILNSLFLWNDFFIPLILLSKRQMQTVIVALASLAGRYNQNPPLQYAGMALAGLPVVVLYVILQRFIIKGITMGSIK